MRDQQDQHVVVSICSIIIGNQLTDRRETRKPQPEQPEAESVAREEQPVPMQPDPQPALEVIGKVVSPSERRPAGKLPSAIGKAVGTLCLAWLVWRILGCHREREQG